MPNGRIWPWNADWSAEDSAWNNQQIPRNGKKVMWEQDNEFLMAGNDHERSKVRMRNNAELTRRQFREPCTEREAFRTDLQSFTDNSFQEYRRFRPGHGVEGD